MTYIILMYSFLSFITHHQKQYTMRFATFNVENLFSRAKALNLRTNEAITEKVKLIGQLQDELQKDTYNKALIFKLYQDVSHLIDVQENRGKLFTYSGTKKTGIKAKGRADWDGEITFKREQFSEMAREATAKVIKTVKAGIQCLIEVENRETVQNFYGDMLRTQSYRLEYNMSIDGFDPRGIDVALMAKYPIKNIRTHIFDRSSPNSPSRTFSRDCMEIELELTSKKSIHVLCNHFVSKLNADSDTRRKSQATAVRDILRKNYDLKKDYVIVAGDFNDTPDSDPMSPLMNMKDMHDVLELQFGNDMLQRWTYHYKKHEQIDYILISEALKSKFVAAGVERRGMYDIEDLTQSGEKRFPIIKEYKDSASDHGAVWADFNL